MDFNDISKLCPRGIVVTKNTWSAFNDYWSIFDSAFGYAYTKDYNNLFQNGLCQLKIEYTGEKKGGQTYIELKYYNPSNSDSNSNSNSDSDTGCNNDGICTTTLNAWDGHTRTHYFSASPIFTTGMNEISSNSNNSRPDDCITNDVGEFVYPTCVPCWYMCYITVYYTDNNNNQDPHEVASFAVTWYQIFSNLNSNNITVEVTSGNNAAAEDLKSYALMSIGLDCSNSSDGIGCYDGNYTITYEYLNYSSNDGMYSLAYTNNNDTFLLASMNPSSDNTLNICVGINAKFIITNLADPNPIYTGYFTTKPVWDYSYTDRDKTFTITITYNGNTCSSDSG